jgi:hypothetical protein
MLAVECEYYCLLGCDAMWSSRNLLTLFYTSSLVFFFTEDGNIHIVWHIGLYGVITITNLLPVWTLVVIADNLRELGFVLVEIKYGMVY